MTITGNPVEDFFNKPKPSTGVHFGPLAFVRLPERINIGSGGGAAKPAQPAVPPVIQRIRDMYGNLGSQLGQLSADERQRIIQSTGDTVRMLQTIDPLAGYRETAPQLSAPAAAATSYLNAIGANPAQVQAQQALGNQMLASQAQSQSAFSNAMDQYLNNYQKAQEAQAYLNQNQALANLGYSTNAQQAGIGFAQMQAENQIRQMMLDYMAKVQAAAAQASGKFVPSTFSGPFGSSQSGVLF